MKMMWSIAALLAAIYGAVIGVMYLYQRALLYPSPETVRTSPAAAGLPEAQEVVLDTRDSAKIILWHVPPKDGKPVVLFFHGNGEVLAWRVPFFRDVISDGTGLVALSYRGYGGSSGQPTEPNLLSDGMAAYEFAAARYTPQRIVPWGYSLGTGVAVAVAASRPVGKLVLEAPYTSIIELAASKFPFLPVRWLMLDHYRSDQRIASIKVPLLILHGEKDSVVPVELGRRLFELANEPKRFVAFPQGTHVDLGEQGATAVAKDFIKRDFIAGRD
ncbi:MAG: alpha/beta hydrolase [Xanthobacteraceae bacterium]|nr:alpha/beta hydrolase [Xanthobacteraceae bacterium]